MVIYLQKEIAHLEAQILTMCNMAEGALSLAVQSLHSRNVELAKKVIDNDRDIDLFELEIEDECLKILALYQPVANDLRFVIAILKINSDLERIGDLAVNIAERTISISADPRELIPPILEEMEQKVQAMLKDAIDSLVNLDERLARDLLARDDEVDQLYRKMFILVEDSIRNKLENLDSYQHLLSVSSQLERAADQVTNIAEDIIYIICGEIIRHHQSLAKN